MATQISSLTVQKDDRVQLLMQTLSLHMGLEPSHHLHTLKFRWPRDRTTPAGPERARNFPFVFILLDSPLPPPPSPFQPSANSSEENRVKSPGTRLHSPAVNRTRIPVQNVRHRAIISGESRPEERRGARRNTKKKKKKKKKEKEKLCLYFEKPVG
ncbi:hypothetical protein INR49_011594 [Caranx melampygus]|nr:hypothetical protein INR49_011594 [Caranx melampygus]